jgi:hypothetical protein
VLLFCGCARGRVSGRACGRGCCEAEGKRLSRRDSIGKRAEVCCYYISSKLRSPAWVFSNADGWSLLFARQPIHSFALCLDSATTSDLWLVVHNFTTVLSTPSRVTRLGEFSPIG